MGTFDVGHVKVILGVPFYRTEVITKNGSLQSEREEKLGLAGMWYVHAIGYLESLYDYTFVKLGYKLKDEKVGPRGCMWNEHEEF